MLIAPEQIRAARALLRLEQEDLAQRAQVSIVTIRRLESEHGGDKVAPRTIDVVRHALEQAGAEFIPNGVRSRQTRPSRDTDARFAALHAISLRGAELLQGQPALTDDDLYGEDGLPR